MNRTWIIRKAQQADTAALSDLAILTYSAAFGHSLSDADLAAHVRKHLSPCRFARFIDDDVVLVAEDGSRLVGYVQFGAVDSAMAVSTDQEVRRLYVHPQLQNAGIGTALMEAALRHPHLRRAASVVLDVWEQNHGAHRFYRRFGFRAIGTRTFTVESGAATSLDIVMVRRAATHE